MRRMQVSDLFKAYAPVILAIFVALALGVYGIMGTEGKLMHINGRATYDYNSIEFISFDWEKEHVFYYTNQLDELYLKGSIEKVAEDRYLLTCQCEKIFPQQIISFSDKILTLMIQGKEKSFIKTSDVIEIVGDIERYQ